MALKDSIRIGSTVLNNRLALAPAATNKSDRGTVTDALIEHYVSRSKGGVPGLIITEHCFVRADGMAGTNQVSVSRDEDIEGLARLAKAVKDNGSAIIMQISHAGAAIKASVVDHEGISPSGIPGPKGSLGPGELQKTRPMSISEIGEIREAFVKAAVRAKKAGFDGVEIHSAHAYLLNQFYSPMTNKRTDEYGNGIDGRIKLHIEILKAVRETVGNDFTVGIRLGGSDYMEGGSTIEDAAYAAKKFEEAGADFIDLSGGMCFYILPDRNYPGYFGDMGEAVKKAVSVPVILAGGLKTGQDAENLLQEGKADIAAVARPLLQDPEWAKKAFASLD